MKVYYSYEQFAKDTNTLIEKIAPYKPEAIVGIPRGGLKLSHAVAEGLSIRKLQKLRTELYDGMSKRSEISLYGSCDFTNIKRVIILDDISDSGQTLQKVMEHLKESFPNVEFKSATLFYKTTSVYEPDYWINEATEWIDFFWEVDYKL